MKKGIPFTQIHEDLLFSMAKKLDEHSAKFDEHSAKFDKHSAKLDEHSAKHDEHSAKLDEISRKQDKHDKEIHRLGVLMEHTNANVTTILEVVTQSEERWQQQMAMGAMVENHEHRISAIESHIKS